MIKVDRLEKSFGATKAVDDVSFELKAGEVLGFLGPNGAGKSTTMKIMTTYLSADSGSVSVEGFDTEENAIEVRRRIGYLPENNPLYVDMDVLDYLCFVAQVRRLPAATRTKRLKEVIGMCALGDVQRKNIGQLSKGYRQRVGLASALLHDPGFLILDEPTSGLDPSQIKEIRNMIREIGKEKAIIISTHILPEVEAMCDRAIIINRGRLVAEGVTSELSAKAAGEKIVYTAIKSEASDVREKLAALEGVSEVTVRDSLAQGHNSFALKCSPDKEISEAVYDLSVAEGWKLTELHSEVATLEDVFLQLTKD